jgi:hypothetical protein
VGRSSSLLGLEPARIRTRLGFEPGPPRWVEVVGGNGMRRGGIARYLHVSSIYWICWPAHVNKTCDVNLFFMYNKDPGTNLTNRRHAWLTGSCTTWLDSLLLIIVNFRPSTANNTRKIPTSCCCGLWHSL